MSTEVGPVTTQLMQIDADLHEVEELGLYQEARLEELACDWAYFG